MSRGLQRTTWRVRARFNTRLTTFSAFIVFSTIFRPYLFVASVLCTRVSLARLLSSSSFFLTITQPSCHRAILTRPSRRLTPFPLLPSLPLHHCPRDHHFCGCTLRFFHPVHYRSGCVHLCPTPSLESRGRHAKDHPTKRTCLIHLFLCVSKETLRKVCTTPRGARFCTHPHAMFSRPLCFIFSPPFPTTPIGRNPFATAGEILTHSREKNAKKNAHASIETSVLHMCVWVGLYVTTGVLVRRRKSR